MTDKEQPPQPSGKDAATPGGRTRSGWFVVLPALALVIGLVLGGLIVGVALDGSPTDEGPSSDPTSTDSPSPDPDGSTPTDDSGGDAGGDVEIVVPQECLDAADTVERATQVMRDGVGAIEDFDRQPLLDALNRLEDLEAQARAQADRCSQVEVNR